MLEPFHPTTTEPGHEPELRAVNRELAALLHAEPADLAFGADLAATDDLVICGILGGKDVGKSTLINALANAQVSVDEAEVGRGTDRPVAYAHRAAEAAVRRRLGLDDAREALQLQWHEADAVRSAVLVDLPDFDSQFQDHLEVVLDVAPVLDRIIWVVTPRKMGDREWVRMLRKVVKDVGNVYVVLNKADEFLADLEPSSTDGADGVLAESFWPAHREWMTGVLDGLACPVRDDQRFLVAGGYADEGRFVQRIGELWDDPGWAKNGSERPAVAEIARRAIGELNRLRSQVLAEVPRAQAAQIKRANRARQTDVNIARIRRHYDLDQILAELRSICDEEYVRQLLEDAVPAPDRFVLAADLAARIRPERDLADELLEQRVERWPLLQLAHWPFGWLARAVAPIRRLIPAAKAARDHQSDPQPSVHAAAPGDLPPTPDQLELFRSSLLRDHAALIDRIEIETELPLAETLVRRVRSAADRVPGRIEARMMASLRSARRSRIAGFLGNSMLWLTLLWFPLLQPIAAGMLEIYAEPGAFRWAHGLYRVVSALSAAHLLAGLAVVVAIYLALIAGMYVRCLRSVRTAMGEHLSLRPDATLPEAVDRLLLDEFAAPLLRPIHDRLSHLKRLHDRIERLASGPEHAGG